MSSGSRVQKTRYWREKWKTRLERRLTWAPQLAFVLALGLAILLAPTVDSKHSPDRLTNWFIAALGLLGTLSVTLIFFQRSPGNGRALRFLGVRTVLFALVGIIASAIGLLPLGFSAYQYVFGLSSAGLAAVACTTALVGVTSLRGQKRSAEDEKLNQIAAMQQSASKSLPSEIAGQPTTDDEPAAGGEAP